MGELDNPMGHCEWVAYHHGYVDTDWSYNVESYDEGQDVLIRESTRMIKNEIRCWLDSGDEYVLKNFPVRYWEDLIVELEGLK